MCSFSKCSEKVVFPQKTALEYDRCCIVRKDHISFYRRKVKDHFLKKIHGNMIFSVYSIEMVFLFPTNMTLPFCQKSKDDLLPKNTLKR